MLNKRENAPAIVLARPQMGENIGAAARVMRNFGLSEMRISAPRDGWPNEKAWTMSAGATNVLDSARVTEDFTEALEGLTLVFAATARRRDLMKPVVTAREAMAQAREEIASGGRVGVVFGAEASGLKNEEVAVADAILTLPVDPEFSSLNLAQAVAVTAYEWKAGDPLPEDFAMNHVPADKAALTGLMSHLETELEDAGFFFPPEKAEKMKLNLRSTLTRGRLTDQEIHTFRGAIKALAEKRRRAP